MIKVFVFRKRINTALKMFRIKISFDDDDNDDDVFNNIPIEGL